MKIFLSFITNWSEPFSYLLYFISVLLYYKYDKTNKIKVLIVYYGIAFILMSIGSYCVYLLIPNLWAYNILFFTASICIPYYFLQIITSPQKRIIIRFCLFASAGYLLLKVLMLEGRPPTFMSIGYALIYASVVLMVLMYFHQILKNVNEEKIFLNFNFWVSISYLLNFLGGFFVILSYSYLSNKIFQNKTYSSDIFKERFLEIDFKERLLLTELWAFPNMLLLLSSIILIFGTLWITYQKKSP